MLDNVKQHFYEGFRLSSETKDKILERWGVTYHAVEEARSSLEREFGADLTQPEQTVERPVDPVNLASNVIDLETRREQRVLSEQSDHDRYVASAQLAVEEAYRRELSA